MARMLRIATDLWPQSLLTYVAFRVALRLTVDCLAKHGPEGPSGDGDEPGPYLAEVPFLREVPLPIQLELLAETWERHLARDVRQAGLLDESVVYAVCESAARAAEHQPERITWALRGGPVDLTVPADQQLAAEFRALYLKLSNDGDFLLISQFLDLPPEAAADWKARMGLDEERSESLFEVLGRWHARPELVGKLQGLITLREAEPLARLAGTALPA